MNVKNVFVEYIFFREHMDLMTSNYIPDKAILENLSKKIHLNCTQSQRNVKANKIYVGFVFMYYRRKRKQNEFKDFSEKVFVRLG